MAFFSVFLAAGSHASAQVARFERVSVSSTGTQADAISNNPSISEDGRFVAFNSSASNLAPDTNNTVDVFVRDRQTNTTTLVSVTSAGAQGVEGAGSYLPHISANGRFVTFASLAKLSAADTAVCDSSFLTCMDIYVHDRQTHETSLVSVSSAGVPGNSHSDWAHISGDGRFVVFQSYAGNLVDDDLHIAGSFEDQDIFLRDRQTNTTTRLSPDASRLALNAARISDDGQVVVFGVVFDGPGFAEAGECKAFPCQVNYAYSTLTGARTRIVANVPLFPGYTLLEETIQDLSADGRFLAMARRVRAADVASDQVELLQHDRLSGRSARLSISSVGATAVALALSGDGRYVAAATSPFQGPGQPDLMVYERLYTMVDPPNGTFQTRAYQVDLSGDGRFLVIASTAGGLVANDTNNSDDIFVLDRDADGDGALDWWETTFGFDPSSATDSGADPDHDGRSNVQEYQAGTHPRGTVTRYLAEGAANGFFATRLAIASPTVTDNKSVVVRFLGANGNITGLLTSLGLTSAVFLSEPGVGSLPFLPPDDAFSIVVESEQALVVERTMTWDTTGYGAHAETAIEAPSTTWYVAEGATGGPFDLFYLLQNPGSSPAHVTVTYLRPSPAAPITKTYALAPNSRRTIWVDTEDVGLEATDVSARILSDVPLVVERSLYLSRPGQPFAAGLAGAAITTPARRWFLAEGATGPFFDTYVLVANAETTDAQIRLTYLLPDGSSFSADHVIARESRRTLLVDEQDPRLSNTPVSVIVESLNDVPLVVERSMWWPEGHWYEGHLVAGATATGTRWALADGIVNRFAGTETYILIANTSPIAGSATVTLIDPGGNNVTKTVSLPAQSRVTVPVSEMFEIGTRFSALVQSDGVEIVVERAMYFSTADTIWAAGTALLGTRVP